MEGRGVTYVHRKIRVSFTNAATSGGAPNKGGATFEGLRVHAKIVKTGPNYGSQAQIMLWGLSLDHINQLSSAGTRYRPQKQYDVSVEAGDDVNGMNLVFTGVVHQAWADFTGMPDVVMIISATGSTAQADVGTTSPTSTPGPTKVSAVLEQLAKAGGLKFENNGVDVILHGLYHWGSPMKQIREIAAAAGIDHITDNQTLAIWPQGGSRQGDILEISAKTGLRDYPTFTEYGVHVKVEFRKPLTYATKIKVVSDLKEANGIWQIIQIDYDLQSETPNGNWFAIIDGQYLGAPVTQIGKT